MPLALGLSVVFELRAILLDRQTALDDAAAQANDALALAG